MNRREPRVAVIGAGSWGTAVAAIVARHSATTMWARSAEVVDSINTRQVNDRYLPGFPLPATLAATTDLQQAVETSDIIIMAVPSHGFRGALTDLAPFLRPWTPVVSLVKGLEQGSHLRMTEIVDQVLPGHPAGVLAGPNIAREVVAGYAAAAVIAMPDGHLAAQLRELFRTRLFRIYSSSDVVGVEISRLGERLGGERDTFSGLAGMGDLVVTCTSPHSRNRHVGEQLGRGVPIEQVLAGMTQVAEGVKAAPAVMTLATAAGVNLPIAREVDAVISGRSTPEQAYRGLINVAPGHEVHGDGW